MIRRDFITLLGGAAATWPLAARAQQSVRNARIGFLSGSPDSPITALGHPAFFDELKKSGYSEGQNLVIGNVRIDQDAQRLFAETAELVRSKVDVLVTEGPEIALRAAIAASRTIAIVMWANNFDPIARGFVNSWQGRVATSPG